VRLILDRGRETKHALTERESVEVVVPMPDGGERTVTFTRRRFEEVIAPLLEAQRVINVPVAKHHSLSRATLGMKNWFGVLGNGRSRLHQGIDRSIAELAATFRPTLTIIDASRVLLGNGPQGGSLDDVRAVGAVCAGVDPVLLDAWGAAQLGLKAADLPYLGEAERRGLGQSDVALVRELGKA
jgi:uncharacterized protein (DUF362 family)